MKKIIALLTLICCFAAILSVSVSAANGNEVDFIVNAENEDITIDVETNFACGSIQGALMYDKEVITYQDIALNDALTDNNTLVDTIKNLDGATKIAIVGDATNGTIGDWAVLNYAGANAKFDITSAKAYDTNGEMVDALISVVFRGDANDDGILNLRDLVRLKKCSAGVAVAVEGKEKNLDVDGNGKINEALDLAQMRIVLLSK